MEFVIFFIIVIICVVCFGPTKGVSVARGAYEPLAGPIKPTIPQSSKQTSNPYKNTKAKFPKRRSKSILPIDNLNKIDNIANDIKMVKQNRRKRKKKHNKKVKFSPVKKIRLFDKATREIEGNDQIQRMDSKP